MKSVIAAIVAAVTLLVATESRACESVALVAPAAVYSAPLQIAAPVVYQPQILAVEVAQIQSYAVEVQQIVVKKQRHRRQPVKAFVQAVTPNRCH